MLKRRRADGGRSPLLRGAVAASALALAFGALWPGVVDASPACASGRDHAALVIDTGARATRYCVDLDAPTVSGLHLIELAADEYGLDYQLGFSGKAVCRLEGVGVDGGECFDAFPDFWAYWRGDGRGGWTWSATGAADTTVAAGDAEGWSWGSGTDAASHQRPPDATAESVCGPPSPGSDDGNPPGTGAGDAAGGGGGGGGGGGERQGPPGTAVGAGAATGEAKPSAAATAAGANGARADGGRRTDQVPSSADEPDRSSVPPTQASSAPPSTSAAASRVEAVPVASAPSEAGPPVAALASAAAAITLLLLAGWLALRRRTGSG